MLPPRALTNASMSEKTTDDDVGLPKTAVRVFRCLEFTGECYHLVLALATKQHWRADLAMVNAAAQPAPKAVGWSGLLKGICAWLRVQKGKRTKDDR